MPGAASGANYKLLPLEHMGARESLRTSDVQRAHYSSIFMNFRKNYIYFTIIIQLSQKRDMLRTKMI